jgi:thiamine biosynthesis protein ThiS
MVKAGDKEFQWQEGMTISDILQKLEDSYPYAVARVNDRLISRPDFHNVTIPDGSEIFLLPLIAGG